MKKTDLKALVKNIPSIPVHDCALTDECFNGMTLRVKERLDMQAASAFVESAVSSTIDMTTGNYTPEFLDFVIRMMTLRFFADIPVEEYEMGVAYELIYGTSIVSNVVDYIDGGYYAKLCAGVNSKVNYMRAIQESAPAMKVDQLMNTMQQMIASSSEAVEMINSTEFKDMIGRLGEATKKLAENQKTEEPKQEAEPAVSGQLVAFPAQTVEAAVTEAAAAAKPAPKKRSKKAVPKTE